MVSTDANTSVFGPDNIQLSTNIVVNMDNNKNIRSSYPNHTTEVNLTKTSSVSAQITGILKGGKLWKSDQVRNTQKCGISENIIDFSRMRTDR